MPNYTETKDKELADIARRTDTNNEKDFQIKLDDYFLNAIQDLQYQYAIYLLSRRQYTFSDGKTLVKKANADTFHTKNNNDRASHLIAHSPDMVKLLLPHVYPFHQNKDGNTMITLYRFDDSDYSKSIEVFILLVEAALPKMILPQDQRSLEALIRKTESKIISFSFPELIKLAESFRANKNDQCTRISNRLFKKANEIHPGVTKTQQAIAMLLNNDPAGFTLLDQGHRNADSLDFNIYARDQLESFINAQEQVNQQAPTAAQQAAAAPNNQPRVNPDILNRARIYVCYLISQIDTLSDKRFLAIKEKGNFKTADELRFIFDLIKYSENSLAEKPDYIPILENLAYLVKAIGISKAKLTLDRISKETKIPLIKALALIMLYQIDPTLENQKKTSAELVKMKGPFADYFAGIALLNSDKLQATELFVKAAKQGFLLAHLRQIECYQTLPNMGGKIPSLLLDLAYNSVNPQYYFSVGEGIYVFRNAAEIIRNLPELRGQKGEQKGEQKAAAQAQQEELLQPLKLLDPYHEALANFLSTLIESGLLKDTNEKDKYNFILHHYAQLLFHKRDWFTAFKYFEQAKNNGYIPSRRRWVDTIKKIKEVEQKKIQERQEQEKQQLLSKHEKLYNEAQALPQGSPKALENYQVAAQEGHLPSKLALAKAYYLKVSKECSDDISDKTLLAYKDAIDSLLAAEQITDFSNNDECTDLARLLLLVLSNHQKAEEYRIYLEKVVKPKIANIQLAKKVDVDGLMQRFEAGDQDALAHLEKLAKDKPEIYSRIAVHYHFKINVSDEGQDAEEKADPKKKLIMAVEYYKKALERGVKAAEKNLKELFDLSDSAQLAEIAWVGYHLDKHSRLVDDANTIPKKHAALTELSEIIIVFSGEQVKSNPHIKEIAISARKAILTLVSEMDESPSTKALKRQCEMELSNIMNSQETSSNDTAEGTVAMLPTDAEPGALALPSAAAASSLPSSHASALANSMSFLSPSGEKTLYVKPEGAQGEEGEQQLSSSVAAVAAAAPVPGYRT